MLCLILNRGLPNYVPTNPLTLGTTTRGIIKCNNKVAEYLNDKKQEYQKQLKYQATLAKLPMSEPKNNWFDATKIWNIFKELRFSFDIKTMGLRNAAQDAKVRGTENKKSTESDVPEEKPLDKKK